MTQIKNLQDIVVAGRAYGTQGVELKGILKFPYNITFGRNGSGKSTLAKAIRNFVEGDSDAECQMSFGKNPPAVDKANVYLFDDDFVDRNIRLTSTESGLGAIALIGAQVHQDDQIAKDEQLYANIQSSVDTVQQTLSNLETECGQLQKSIEKSIVDSGYKRRIYDIRNVKKASYDLDEIRNEGLSYDWEMNVETLRKSLEERVTDVVMTQDISTPVTWETDNLSLFPSEAAKRLLRRKVEPAELSERDRMIMEFASNYASITRDLLLKQRARFCPMCHQEIDDSHRLEVEKRLSNFFGREIQQYQKELQKLIDELTPIEVPENPMKSSRSVWLYPMLVNAIEQENARRAKWRALLQERKNNPTGITRIPRDIESNVDEQLFHKLVNDWEDEIRRYNQLVQSRSAFQQRLLKQNRVLAYLENKPAIELLYKKQKDKSVASRQLNELGIQLKMVAKRIMESRRKMLDVHVAVKQINKLLNTVFFDNRICLEEKVNRVQDDDGGTLDSIGYQVKVRGKSVNPNEISTGERNILALAYFFVKIAEGSDFVNNKKPMLVVIDDPVSSFDAGNKAALSAMLHAQLVRVLTTNKNREYNGNKVLVLTHDISTVRYLKSVRYAWASAVFKDKNPYYQADEVFDLNRRELLSDGFDSEYHFLLKRVMGFALSEDPEDQQYVSVGNEMRRVLESFARMMYKQNIGGMFKIDNRFYAMAKGEKLNPKITDNALVGERKNFFRNYLSSTILHAGSHTNVEGGADVEDGNTYTRGEYQKFARIMLLFMLYNQEDHVISYLGIDARNRILAFDTYLDESSLSEVDNVDEEMLVVI